MSTEEKTESKYDVASAVACIKRTGGKVTKKGHISHPKPGLKVLGAIDFLVNHNKYKFINGGK